MSDFSHCQRCGRRLRDAIFCPACRQCLCSFACLDTHMAEHRAPTATSGDPIEPAGAIDPLPEGREIGAEVRSGARADGSVRLRRAEGPGTLPERAAPASRPGRSA